MQVLIKILKTEVLKKLQWEGQEGKWAPHTGEEQGACSFVVGGEGARRTGCSHPEELTGALSYTTHAHNSK